jgi:hypothetical protein
MAQFNKINDFVEYAVEGMNLGSDTLKVTLSNTAPASETTPPTGDGDGVLANVTQVSNIGNVSNVTLSGVTSSQTGGTYKLSATDKVLSATGTVGPFQYIYIYDDTVAGDPLIGYYNYGSAITLQNGDSFTIDFGVNGILTLT